MLDREHVIISDHLKRGDQIGPELAPMTVSDGAEEKRPILLVAVRLGIENTVNRVIHVVQLRVLGMTMEHRLAQHANGGARIDALPEHVTRIEVAAQGRARLAT